jgi:hypothetical protein
MISFTDKLSGLFMHLLNEWASGIYPTDTFFTELFEIAWPTAMGRNNDKTSFWNFLKISLKDYSLSLKKIHHKTIVNDFVVHINRRGKGLKNLKKQVHRSVDSCTIPSRKCGI